MTRDARLPVDVEPTPEKGPTRNERPVKTEVLPKAMHASFARMGLLLPQRGEHKLTGSVADLTPVPGGAKSGRVGRFSRLDGDWEFTRVAVGAELVAVGKAVQIVGHEALGSWTHGWRLNPGNSRPNWSDDNSDEEFAAGWRAATTETPWEVHGEYLRSSTALFRRVGGERDPHGGPK